MKKIFCFITVIILLFALCGCGLNENITQTSDTDIRIWTDEETGVQYVIYCHAAGYKGMGGITPRLNSDGSLYMESEVTE